MNLCDLVHLQELVYTAAGSMTLTIWNND